MQVLRLPQLSTFNVILFFKRPHGLADVSAIVAAGTADFFDIAIRNGNRFFYGFCCAANVSDAVCPLSGGRDIAAFGQFPDGHCLVSHWALKLPAPAGLDLKAYFRPYDARIQ